MACGKALLTPCDAGVNWAAEGGTQAVAAPGSCIDAPILHKKTVGWRGKEEQNQPKNVFSIKNSN